MMDYQLKELIDRLCKQMESINVSLAQIAESLEKQKVNNIVLHYPSSDHHD